MRSGTISVITLLFLLYMSNFGQPNILSIPFTNIGFQLNHFNFVCRFTKEVIQVKKVGYVMNVVMFLAGNKLWIFTNPNTVANTILFVRIVIVVLTAKQFCTSTVWLIQARTSSDLDGTLYLFSIYEIPLGGGDSMCTLGYMWMVWTFINVP